MKISTLSLLLLLCLPMPLSAGEPTRFGRLLAKVYLAMNADDTQLVLVSFTDRGAGGRELLAAPSRLVSERSLHRRAKMRPAGALVDERDLPLARSYVRAVAGITGVRHELKWFNAVSVLATRRQIDALARLPFVRELELVGRWKKRAGDESAGTLKDGDLPAAPQGTTSLNYGTSYTQNNQINVVAVHDLGIYGQGVVVGVFDNGFRNPNHVAFDSMTIIATHDFVDHKESVVPLAPASGFGSHGNWTLSTIGGYRPGQLIGPAFKSSYILARTENDSSETPVEEDNWAAAIEWADSLGIDVASTSLGYLTFDPPYTSLTWADMNGSTALITLAADHAASLGIVIVNSAGNEGPGDGVHNTLIAPADGFDVITAGAVTSAGVRTSFSSVGPTTDVPARIKPDIMAMGSGVKAASATDTVNYVSVSGTSFSCPLSAGVAALILCANPSLTPFQVREAMRNTANNAGAPNNQYGWGILNALAAVRYYPTTPLPRITGTVYHDRNNDGTQDLGEGGVAGVTVRLGGTMTATAVTDSLGRYGFDSLALGNYSVEADSVAGWTRTSPIGAPYAVAIDSANEDRSGVDFGYRKPGRIAGTTFRDININGAKDAGEPALAGAVLHLDGPVSLRAVADGDGAFAFTGLDAGTYVLSESLEVGWVLTTPPAPETLLVVSGTDTSGLLFGSYYPGEYWVLGGWNILSLPQRPGDRSPASLYPDALSPAFGYGPGYFGYDTIPPGRGYWLKFPSAEFVSVDGDPVFADTIAITAGWNLVGSVALPTAASAVVAEPAANLLTPFYAYNGVQYLAADTLRPHRGYWVKAAGPGTLVMNPLLAAAAAPPRPGLPAPAGALVVRTADGMESTLPVFDDAAGERTAIELPPVPPAGVFDARFSSDRAAELFRGSAATYGVRISATGPVTAEWRSDRGVTATLRRPGTPALVLPPGARVPLAGAAWTLELRAGSVAVPTAFALGQNYPNPFNPSTVIDYAVAAPGRVTITVVSVLGEIVATLVDDERAVGAYSATWDAAGVPSGVYYCQMRAGAFSGVRKMLLLK